MSVRVRSLRLVVFATSVLCLHAIRPAGIEHDSRVSSVGSPSAAGSNASPPKTSHDRLPVRSSLGGSASRIVTVN